MGLRYRKSIKVGKFFRINVSKSGIGYSIGVPGARYTVSANGRRTITAGIPGTGISYSQSVGGNSRRSQSHTYNQPTVDSGIAEAASQESAAISNFQPVEMKELLSSLRKSHFLYVSGSVLLIIGIIFLFATFISFNIGSLVIGLIGTMMGSIFLYLIHHNLCVVLEYEIDSEMQYLHSDRVAAFDCVFQSKKVWQTLTSAIVTNQKTHAGAGNVVTRFPISQQKNFPPYLKSNAEIIYLKLKSEKLYILPDKIIIQKGGKFGAIDYKDVNTTVYTGIFIENQGVPSDAQIIGYTWQYVNKNGSPDKRYSNNRQLPRCKYGYIKLESPSGLNVELCCSDYKRIVEFGQGFGNNGE